ncbi:hypothetical protein A2995_00510 [Candidatus Nomurabacteria bacterium RIFCSPLOWO2_01_FULL_33_24]|uniref:Uncharacterized protein n=1 Tax=Candidatus Nomurabacteria bacterium RIFCSPLOWO2_01_FULL_33_24 TaxID=1801765 RepID=A0A1F6WYQ6_9BACT|nr:MAG: hypothetical protein A2995_00510 [Candidatus Nomurabacteria bacterium RIFCSPLOWO2_01_FULL_33_24]
MTKLNEDLRVRYLMSNSPITIIEITKAILNQYNDLKNSKKWRDQKDRLWYELNKLYQEYYRSNQKLKFFLKKTNETTESLKTNKIKKETLGIIQLVLKL